MKPIYIMMAGLPGSGKSYAAEQIMDIFTNVNFEYVSTDAFIENEARIANKTYAEMFQSTIDTATKVVNSWRQDFLDCRLNIIHDQTNLTVKSRAKKLVGIPKEYTKIAIWCKVDETVRQERLLNRPGKSIPKHVDMQMRNSEEQPMLSEGFNCVVLSTIWKSALREYLTKT